MAKRKQESQKKTTKRKKRINLEGQPTWFSSQRLHWIVIFAIGFLVYANTLGHDYTQDDAIVITENMFTTKGISGFGGILQYDTFYGFFKEEGKANLVTGGRYRPFSLLTFAVEYSIFGENPAVSHLLNALLFAFTALMIYWVLLRLIPVGKYGTEAYFIALATALLFAVHPIHTEAVANIKGRDEILAFLGSLGALYFALQAFEKKQWLPHLWGALCLFAGMLSKENAITFVAIIPLTLYFFTTAKTADLFKVGLPYLAAALVFIGMRSAVVPFSLGEKSYELMNNPFLRLENGRYVAISFGEQMATVMYTLGKYVQLLIFPHPLTHDYYPKHIDLKTWGDPMVLLSLVLYIGMIAYAIWGLRQKDWLSYGILFYLLSLSIVSNVVFAIGTNMAERLIFMPSVGFCFIVAVLLYRLGKRLAPNKKLKQFKQLQIPLLLLGVFGIALAAKTVMRNTAWKDNYTLFTTDIQTSQNSAKLRAATGGELIAQFNAEPNESLKTARLTEAVGHLQEATRLHPTYKLPYHLMGNAHYYLKNYDAAIDAYDNALALDGGYTEAIQNIAITYREAGKQAGEQQNDLNKAVQYLTKSLEYNNADFEANRLLGVAYGMAGQGQQAVNYFQRAADISPETASIWYNLGTAYYSIENEDLGQQYHQKALQMDPQVVEKMRAGQ
ncbi:MAG: tetratricopeptide repeat protein [Bacteroidota bacterium]